MSKESFELAILISLRDAASAGASRVEDRLRAMGKEGKQALKTYGELRKEFAKGVTTAGVGVAGLMLLKSGMRDAGNFETALLDLRSAFQEVGEGGSVNLVELQGQLNRAETLTVNLGNKLQGTTRDYIEILASLKKAGVDPEVILGGAGEAAGKLANVTGAILNRTHIEQAKELGQFGKMFRLKPEDFATSVDLFSALRDRFDIESSSLIESSKYFLATASSLNQVGMQGATDIVKVFALLKRNAALEGSQAGTSLTSMFTMFVTHQDKIKKLAKQNKVSLNFFDKKGQFLGWENLFKEAEKLRNLAPQKRMEMLTGVFGEQGAKAFNAFVESGVDGWKNITAEAKKAVTVNDKINAQMETYNAKVEALLGSIDNLKATAFTPLLTTLKPVVDTANSVVGAIQAMAKENPQLAAVATHLIGIGSAALIVKGGFHMMRGAWGMWRIASAVGGGEVTLLRFLKDTERGADRAGQSLGRLGKGWRGVGIGISKSLLGGLAVGLPLYAIEELISGRLKTGEADTAARAAGERLGELIGEGMKRTSAPVLEAELNRLWQERAEQEAPLRVEELGLERTADNVGMFESASKFTSFLAMARGYDYFNKKGYGGPLSSAGELFKPGRGVEETEEAAREKVRGVLYSKAFIRPEQLREFLNKAREALIKGNEPLLFEELRAAAKDAYPQLMKSVEESDATLRELSKSQDGAAKASDGVAMSLLNLSRTVDGLTFKTFPDLPFSGPRVGPGFGNRPGGKGFNSFWGREPVAVTKNARGGRVETDGFVYVHSQEDIVPARVTRGFRAAGGEMADTGSRSSRQGAVHLHFHIAKDAPAAQNQRALMHYVTSEVRRQRERR